MPFAELATHRVFYEEQGEGEPVLLLAGLGADHRAWALQADAIGQRYHVVVFDNPGVGQTTGPPGPYTSELIADVAAGLLTERGIGRAHVIGASMGGTIAQELALRHPTLVRSLSLHGTWGRADNHLVALLRSWQTYARAVPFLDLCRQIWLWSLTVTSYNERPELIATLEEAVAASPDLQTPDQFCDQAEACIVHDTLDRLGEISAPTLIAVGDRDLMTPTHHAYLIKERIPHAIMRVWGRMGHAPFLEIPDEWGARQQEFLAAN
jgi:pimeloyl-ACP methyl ester carboxylesterase